MLYVISKNEIKGSLRKAGILLDAMADDETASYSTGIMLLAT